jgi:predicted butyrate kinase (DUF1464 family)
MASTPWPERSSESTPGPRVAGVDPGTVSIDVCALEGGEVLFEQSFRSAELALDPAPLVDALLAHRPLDLVLGPAGYGLPLVPGDRVGDRELALIVLLRRDEAGARAGIGGMRAMIRALLGAGLPLVFGPGVIHLPTVPEHRKWNRIDLGTADKVCSAALCVVDQADRLGLAYEETSFILLELGGAFSAALAVDGGQIVDGLGGSSAPIGARSCGALDAEAAYLLGATLSKETVFSGGALDPGGELDLSAPGALAALRADIGRREGWVALEEGAVKAALALTVSVPEPREILVAGRLAGAPGVLDALTERLAGVATVAGAVGPRARTAAQGAAVLADGLAGGRYAPLVERLRLREAGGTALDHLRMRGAESISLA